MRASRDPWSGDGTIRGRIGSTFAPRWLAGPGIIRGDLRAGRGRATRAPRRRRAPPRTPQGARCAQPELLGDDRRVGLDVDGEALQADDPAGTRGGRHPLGNERLERGDRPGQAQLVLEAQRPGRIRDEVADPAHRPSRGVVIASRPDAAHGRRRAPSRRPRRGPPTAWATARRRRVEVVERRRRHEGLGQLGDAAHEVRPAIRVELAEDVIEQQQRRPAVELGQQVELGELEGEDRGALLAARGEPGQVPPGQVEGEVVAVRPDDGRAVPDLLLGGLDEAPGEGVARRLAGRGRGVGDVAQGQTAGRGLLRRDLAVGGRQRARPGVSSRRSRASTTRPPVSRKVVVPEPQLVAGGGLLADRPQQAVALLERAAVGRRGRRRRPGSGPRPGRRWPPAAGTASRSTSSISSGANSTTRRCRPRTARPAADAVDPDPLAAAAAVRAGAGDRDLEDVAPDPPLDPGEVATPADQLAVGAGAVRPAPAEQRDRLEQAGLAGGVRARGRGGHRRRRRPRARRTPAGRAR